MNKLTLGLFTLGSFLLTGCSDSEGPKEPVIPASNTIAVFTPSTGDLPLPNDLIFGGTTDFTLNVPGITDPTDYSNPLLAISSLDGWSTTAAFAFSLRNPDSSISLNASTVIPGSTVRIFEVLADTTFDLNTQVPPTFAPISVIRELEPLVDFVAVPNGMSVGVIPTKPLAERATYIVVATNGIQDSAGRPIIADGQYQIAASDADLSAAGSLAALAPVQALVNRMEDLVSDSALTNPVAKESIVLTFQFTTQSINTVTESAKGMYIDQGAIPATSFSSLTIDTSSTMGRGLADLYEGQITTNYMLSGPTAENPTAPLNHFWRAVSEIPDGSGGTIPNPFGQNLTYVNSLPAVTGQETHPLLVSMPKAANCPKPAAGYPVMLFQHGITSNRTAMLGIADTMASICVAVVSMDMPLHGITEDNLIHQALDDASGGAIQFFEGYTPGGLRERTFGVDYLSNTTGAPGPDGIPDASGAHTINLQNLLVSRDNLRQAIFDLLSLEKAVPGMDVDGGGPDFDANNIFFMGHSLGGIVGSSFVGQSDMVKIAILANPGGGIARLLDASDSFGPRIRAGLAAAGIEAGSPEYDQFMFAAQTVIDSGDPINTTTVALANNIPTLMLRTLNDAVVPNNVATAPLSGTDPLAAYLGLQPVAAENPGPVAGGRLLSRFNSGSHSTVLSPASDTDPVGFLNVTTEMQAHIASFIASGGTAVVVNDPSLLD
ncbi:hypothetical protein [Pleionea sp. CnH1-48]|uniref:hypothetical protein n=1 Tax=Pleionea sp. CnH1-48 TaxID=2954494 RepID=UPI002096E5CC|nr:hypothetical protein [Pleionea sp. CnH1-48]MCO7225415.1 hypothetical protein [Pleionea sp. CnH1-48]